MLCTASTKSKAQVWKESPVLDANVSEFCAPHVKATDYKLVVSRELSKAAAEFLLACWGQLLTPSLQTLFSLQPWSKKVSQGLVPPFLGGTWLLKMHSPEPRISTICPSPFNEGSWGFLSRRRYLLCLLELEEGLVKEKD